MELLKARRVRALGIRCCGCLALIVLLIALACALFFALVFRLVGTAHAAQPNETARHVAILVDQSRSVAAASDMQMLAREITLAAIRQLRASAHEGDTFHLVFFGAKAVTEMDAAPLLDDSLDGQVKVAFTKSRSLGGTAIAETLAGMLEYAPLTGVILITDGIPDTSQTQTPDGRTAYADRLRALAAQFDRRDVKVAVLLIGQPQRDAWLAVWRDLASVTGGVLVEIPSVEDVGRAAGALAAFSPAATPVPTPVSTRRLSPTPDSAPTATAAPRPSHTVVPTSTSEPAARVTSPAWLPVLIGAGLAVAAIGLILAARTLKMAPKPASPASEGDEGILEICDPQTGDMQRVELCDMALGEVWGIGNSPQCRIRIGREAGEDEYAVLALTPDGPQIESRGAPLWYDGHPVKRHLLFDGDDVYLGRFVIGYQNFFRQRGASDLDEEAAPNL